MSTYNLHPAQRLSLLRQRLGLSQRQLAKEFRVSFAAVAHWETGTRVIPGPVLKLIDLYENSLTKMAETKPVPPGPTVSAQLKEYFKSGPASDKNEEQNLLQLLETEFSAFIEKESYLNNISARLKQLFIERFVKSLTNSRGVSAKVAQLASFLEVGLPLEIRHALGTLQSRAEPIKPKAVHKLLMEEYGTDPKNIFPHWQEKPLAVTSIGQVHYAKLADGQEVAVKVQHPEIRKILESQMNKIEFLQSLAALLGKKDTDIIPEIKRALLQECDYRKEARNQEKFANILADDPRVIVPTIHRDLVRDRVLVSSYIRGKNLQNFAATANQNEKNFAAETIMDTLMQAAFGHCLTQSDWHPGNFLFTENKVVLLDFGRIIDYPAERMKLESQFYFEFLNGREPQARVLAQKVFAMNDQDFDSEEFWSFFKQLHLHLLTDDRFHFTRAHAKFLNQQSRVYSKKYQVKMDKNALWGMVFAISTWGIFADLEADINFRKIALKGAKMGTQLRV